MRLQFVCHPQCSTCGKARAWLESRNHSFDERDIRSPNPTAEELRLWISASKQPIRRFFNTSGQQYRAMNLSARLPDMTEQAQLDLLASDGMLVRRPLLIREDGQVLVGFREKEWTEAFSIGSDSVCPDFSGTGEGDTK